MVTEKLDFANTPMWRSLVLAVAEGNDVMLNAQVCSSEVEREECPTNA